MNSLGSLEAWYQHQCNGTWEHSFEINITTLDNPGWSISIDLTETSSANKNFVTINNIVSETEWYTCKTDGQKFLGHGGDAFKIN